MEELIEKAVVLRIIFDSVGKPATEIYQKVRELPAVDAAEELPRGCFNCEYSREGYQTMRCFGQKGAPAVRPSDCCEGWRLAGTTEEQS